MVEAVVAVAAAVALLGFAECWSGPGVVTRGEDEDVVGFVANGAKIPDIDLLCCMLAGDI